MDDKFLTTEKQREMINTAPPTMSDKDVIRRLIARGYELEGLNAEFTPFEAVKNVPGSAVEFAKNIYTALRHPIKTGAALTRIGNGAIASAARGLGIWKGQVGKLEEALVGGEENREAFEAMKGFYVDRYGGGERLLNTIEQDPVGFLADAASLIGGAGMAVKGAGMAGKAAGWSRAAKVAEVGGKIMAASRYLEPTWVGAKAVTEPAKLFMKYTGMGNRMAKIAGEFSQKATYIEKGKTKELGNILGRDEAAILKSNKRFGEWVAERGFMGNLEEISNQMRTHATRTKGLVDTGLGEIQLLYKSEHANAVLKTFNDAFESLGKTEHLAPETIGVWDEVKRLSAKHTTQGLTLSDMNWIKRQIDDIQSPFKGTASISGIGTVDYAKAGLSASNMEKLYQGVRKFIEDKAADNGFADVRMLNTETTVATKAAQWVKDADLSLSAKQAYIDRFIFVGGVVGAAIYNRFEYIIAAAGLTGARMWFRRPEVRSAMGVWLMNKSQRELSILERALKTGEYTSPSKELVKAMYRDISKIYPEERLGGIVVRQQEEQAQEREKANSNQ